MKKQILSRQFYAFFLVFLFILTSIGQTPIVQAQPGGTGIKKLPPIHYVRSRDFDMKHIALDLKFDWDKEQAYGTATITLAPIMPNVKSINLDAGLMIINSVNLSKGRALTFTYDEKESNLNIELDRVYNVGENLMFVVDYRTKGEIIPNTLGFGGGGGGLKFIKPSPGDANGRKQIWSLGESDYNHFWFPSYDSPNDFATSELTATVEKPMFVVSNGKLIKRRDNKNGTETFHWKMDIPHANYLTSIVVGEYAEVKGSYLGIPISTYVFPNELKEGEETAKRLPLMVKFFSEKTGVKYPYSKYAQTVATGFSGGMENISATTMTPQMVIDARTALDNDSDSLQSHELAHQWFGDYVTTREWSDVWLNESFATYFQALWDEESKGRDFFLYSDVRGNQRQYFSTWNSLNRRPVVTKYYTNADDLFDTYAYQRGAAVLHMLRKYLGDEVFFKSLKHYLTTNANKPVQTEQLRIAIEETSGQSMDWFFDQWIYKMGHPIFQIKQDYDEKKKQLILNVKQVQKIDPLNQYPQVEFFQSRVDVEIDNKIEQVWLKPQAENIFTFDVTAKPKLVNFDYESTLIKQVQQVKSIDELIYQSQNDKDMLGRLSAAEDLSLRGRIKSNTAAEKENITSALNHIITNDPFWAVRRDTIRLVNAPAVGGLSVRPGIDGSRPDPVVTQPDIQSTTIDAFLTAAKDKNSQVRAAAIDALGARKDEKYADLFLGALEDQSYSVIESASNALANTKSAKAYDVLAKLADQDSWRDRLHLAGLRSLATLGDRRGLELGLKYSDKSYAANVRLIAVTLISTIGKDDPRTFPVIMENLKSAIETSNRQGISNSLQGFIKLADPRGQQAFDLARERLRNQQNMLALVNNLELLFKKAITPK